MADPRRDPDERVAIPLDPDEALRALLAVDPDDEPTDEDDESSNDDS